MLNNQIKIPSKPILIEDLGMRFPLTTSKQKKRFGIYKCACGNKFKSQTHYIKIGHTKSCGCLNIKLFTTHGKSDTRLYIIYHSMIRRCYDKNHKFYDNYGKRGIIICEEWRNDFMSFYNWSIANGYSESLSIDRIKNSGNYEPNNCRWVKKTVQQQNTRRLNAANTSGYRGVSYNKRNNRFIAQIKSNNRYFFLGSFKLAIDAARAYDKFVIDNNSEHTRNF